MKRRYLTIFVLLVTLQLSAQQNDFQLRLSDAAISIINPRIIYDPNYRSIPYPNGDIDQSKGVCTDVVIRAYRKLGIDLQKEVHEDMKANFNKYPSRTLWELKAPDRNIDHRRVPNLQIFSVVKALAYPLLKSQKTIARRYRDMESPKRIGSYRHCYR